MRREDAPDVAASACDPRETGAKVLNSLYFGIGFTIILALAVALVGPVFVDWTAYRAAFEEQASRIIGHPVEVRGTADARFLPYPSLSFSDVVIGEDASKPLMTVRQFNMEIELFPLLSGQFKVTEMHMVEPELNVRIARDGTLEWIPAEERSPIDPGKVTLSGVDIENGVINIDDARRSAPLALTGIDMRLDARSLNGPYKAEGTFKVDDVAYEVKAGTGSTDAAGRIPLKGTLTSGRYPVSLALDGALEARERRPIWRGKGTLSRVIAKDDRAALPWALTSDLEVTSRQILGKTLEFRYGAEDRPFTITGAATIDLQGEPRFDAVLSARQIDLDRTLGKGPDAPVDLPGALNALAASLSGLPVPPIAGHVGFDIPGIVVGGNILSDLRLDVGTAADGWSVDTLSAVLPGQTQLAAQGKVTIRPTLDFTGDVALSVPQPATLLSWWMPDRPKTALDPFEAKGKLDASPAGFVLSNLAAKLKDGKLAGDVEFTPGRPKLNPRLTLALDADQLDVADISAVAKLFAGSGGDRGAGPDVIVQAAVGNLIAGDARAEGVDISASLINSTLDVDRLFVRSLSGARLTAAGTIRDVTTVPDGSVQLRLSAEKMDGVADLMRAVLPDAKATQLFRTAAPFLSPTSIEATVLAKASGQGTDVRLEVKGSAARTDIVGALSFLGRIDRWDEAKTTLDLTLKGPDGADLMRQFGLDVPSIGDAGLGSLTISTLGKPKDGLAVMAKASMGPTDIALKGSASLARGADPEAELDLDLKSPDIGALLALSGNIMQGVVASTPAELAAHLSARGRKLAIQRLVGTVGGERTTGELAIERGASVPRVTGRLAVDAASLAGLAETVLGSGVLDFPVVASRSPWPEAPFGPALFDSLDSDLALSFGALALTDDVAMHNVTLALRSSTSGTGFDDITGEFAGGKAGGNLLIKRDLDGSAGISGTLFVKGAAAADLAWQRDGRPTVTGDLSSDIQISATGRTVAGWMASLTGGGSFSVTGGAIRSMNTQAFSQVVQLADSGKPLADDRIRQVFTDNVDVGDLKFDRLDATFTLAAGMLRAPTIVVTGTRGETSGGATVDLPHMSLASEWHLEANAGDLAASGGAVPQVAIVYSGPIARPTRKIDVTAFASYLGIRSLEQETQRVLRMQADILERELLSRQVLRDKEAVERAAAAESDAKARRAAADAAAKALREATAKAAVKPPVPKPTKPVAAPADDSVDDFANKILDQLKANQPQLPGSKLPPLPEVQVGPPPGGLSP